MGESVTGAALYRCRVTHRRPGPPRYRFAYRSFYLWLDLDRLDAACTASALISRNRFNLLSFYDRDHGPHDGSSLRAWLDAVLAERGINLDGGRVYLLTMPRVLGYGFNPFSAFYCFGADGGLRAIVAEVHNTFGEHHFYVIHRDNAPMAWSQDAAKTKVFHVSPFFDRSGEYRFHFTRPGDRLGIGIRLYAAADEGGALRLATALSGERRVLSGVEILRAACAMPLMTLKVTAAIHWQALKLWWRGAVFHRKPDPDRSNIS